MRVVARDHDLVILFGVVDPETGDMDFMADGDVETLLALKEHITIDLYTRIREGM